MATQYTAQSLPYPQHSDLVNDVPDYIKNLATALDKKIVGVYADPTALANAGTFTAGSVVFIKSTKTLQVHDGTQWVSIYPSSPRLFSGTAVPASTLGSVGDFYIQY